MHILQTDTSNNWKRHEKKIPFTIETHSMKCIAIKLITNGRNYKS